MHDRVIDKHHQKVPAIGADCDEIKNSGEELDAITEYQRPRTETGKQEDRFKEESIESGMEQTHASKPEDLPA